MDDKIWDGLVFPTLVMKVGEIHLDELCGDITSWRHWNDGECIGNHPRSWLQVFSYFQVGELLTFSQNPWSGCGISQACYNLHIYIYTQSKGAALQQYIYICMHSAIYI
jgi:hypothetical protein